MITDLGHSIKRLDADIRSGKVAGDEIASTRVRMYRGFLNRERERLWYEHQTGARGRHVVNQWTAVVDAVIAEAYRMFLLDSDGDAPPMSLVAVGGYGRAALNPWSDIDLLFLFRDRAHQQSPIARDMLHLLWDLGFDLGHSTRTVEESISHAAIDPIARTALLGSRRLTGDEGLFDQLTEKFHAAFLGNKGRTMAEELLARMNHRRREHGRFVQILEPDLKESTGGLRDVHTLQWVLQARRGATRLEALLERRYLSKRDLRVLEYALDFLYRVRNDLHFRQQKKQDRLELSLQPEVAASLGFEDDALALGVEHFMRQYYLAARDIEFLTDGVCHEMTRHVPRHVRAADKVRRKALDDGTYLVRGKMMVPAKWKAFFADDTKRLMSIFRQSQVFDAPLSRTAIRAIRSSLKLVGDDFRRDPGMSALFLKILGDTQRLPRVLRLMHRVGFLGEYLPEFGRLTGLVQHDLYHAYTADEHTLYAIEKACDLSDGTGESGLGTKVLGEIARPALLHLALLLHDVGKSGGPGHPARGAEMAVAVGGRLGLPKDQIDLVMSVIAEHLLLSHVSQRRDLDDPAQMAQLAESVPDPDMARLLYVHSWCDMQATGPEAASGWKMSLLDTLYLRLFDYLTSSDTGAAGKHDRAQAFDALLADAIGSKRAQKHLDGLPVRYRLTYTADEAAAHAAAADALGQKPAVAQCSVGEPTWQIVVCAQDCPGLLTTICGVLTVHDLNIHRAEAFTRSDGVVLDLFQVTLSSGAATRPTLCMDLEEVLAAVLVGGASLEEMMERHRKRWARRKIPPPTTGDKIILDNGASQAYTVVDVFTDDRIGLLYDVSRVLSKEGVDIHTARIGTDGDRAADAFYVTDLSGLKVEEREKVESIRRALLDALSTDRVQG